jgi:hypothetical protein
MHRAEERAGPEDVGQQALMRGHCPLLLQGWHGQLRHVIRKVFADDLQDA